MLVDFDRSVTSGIETRCLVQFTKSANHPVIVSPRALTQSEPGDANRSRLICHGDLCALLFRI